MRGTLTSFYLIFWTQNSENDYFDVTFNVDGKELYAHRGILAAASDVFKELIIKNRSTPNQLIQIDDFTYDEFFEFLRLIYCNDDENNLDDPDEEYIYALIALAHIYEVYEIKEKCANFLERNLWKFDVKNIFKIIEISHKYSFAYCEIAVFINENFDDFIEFDNFINLNKSVIKAFVYYSKNIDKSEKLCKAVYKWGKHQAMITEDMLKEEKNDLILHYINDILPLLTLKSLLEFYVNQKSLISANEAKKIKTIQVTIKFGEKSVIGTFVDSYDSYEIIKSHENEKLYYFGEKGRSIWCVDYIPPSTPRILKKRENVEWYILFDKYGGLNIKHQSIKNTII